MPGNRTWRSSYCALAVAFCALSVTGCASLRLPRIDPSGERILIWPDAAATIVAPASPTIGGVAPPPPLVTTAPTTPTIPPLGNVDAPPVYPDAGLPPAAPPSTAPAFTPPPAAGTTAAPAPGASTNVVVPSAGAVVTGRDHLQLTPQVVMAPVGSDVVLRAGVCTAGNYLLANQRIDWQLEGDSAGQFVDLNDRWMFSPFRWPWNTPRIINIRSALGATATYPMVLPRNPADPLDDVPIQRGEAWIAVASATEGTSFVTASTPVVGDAQYSRVTATIYWVDAQWVFPPSAMAAPGRPHVLTTTVMRRSNGTPLAGWIVSTYN